MIKLGYKARGGSGYNTKNRRSNNSKKVGGRSQTERSAEAYRQWVYSQNPDARKLSDPEVVRIKSELGHYDRYKQETQELTGSDGSTDGWLHKKCVPKYLKA